MKSETVILPAFLASALINGDLTGLSDGDEKWVEAAIQYCAPGRIVSCEGESFFSWSCELPGFTLGADMLEYIVLYPEEQES